MYYPAGGYLGLYFELFGLQPGGGSGFVDTISKHRTGGSIAGVEIEALGRGIKIGIGAERSYVTVEADPWVPKRRSLGKSYADLRPYTSMSASTTGTSGSMSDEETALLEHYMASLKDES